MKYFSSRSVYLLLLAMSSATFSSCTFGFGVLMTTPEQRLVLDQQRQVVDTPIHHRQRAVPKNVPQLVSFEGIVKRRNGPNSIWLNGEFVERSTSSTLSVDPNKTIENAIAVDLPSAGNAVWLRPGQGVVLEDGKIYENYQQAPAAIVAEKASDMTTLDAGEGALPGQSKAVSIDPQ